MVVFPPDWKTERETFVACDQCRKSKCKCERSSENEPCKACIMLGTRESTLIHFVKIVFISRGCLFFDTRLRPSL
jgi:hypothetical protein